MTNRSLEQEGPPTDSQIRTETVIGHEASSPFRRRAAIFAGRAGIGTRIRVIPSETDNRFEFDARNPLSIITSSTNDYLPRDKS